jgi:hypothetical protein
LRAMGEGGGVGGGVGRRGATSAHYASEAHRGEGGNEVGTSEYF